MRREARYVSAIILGGALVLFAGCGGKADAGPETVPIQAKLVMTKGGTANELAEAGVAIQLESVEQPGVIAYGAILQDGSIKLATQTPTGEKPGLVPGTHRVRLNADERAAQKFARKFLKYETSGITIKAPSDQPIEISVWK